MSNFFQSIRRSFCFDCRFRPKRSRLCANSREQSTSKKSFDSTPKRSARKIIHAQPVCILKAPQNQQRHLAKLFRTNSRAGRFAISSWLGFPCCFQCWLEFRLAFGRVAAALSDTSFLVLPASCKRFRRWHCSRCLFRCRFSESACGLQSRRSFSLVCYRLSATPRLASSTFPPRSPNLLLP